MMINDFWKHPVYDNWEANRKGIVRHVENKKDIGFLTKFGYLQINVRDEGIQKYYLKHRFIFECFHGKINNPKLVVDHINNIKTDNQLQNLQLITQSQNLKKEHRKGENLPPIRVRAININSGESFDYKCIVYYECSKTQLKKDINVGKIQSTSVKMY